MEAMLLGQAYLKVKRDLVGLQKTKIKLIYTGRYKPVCSRQLTWMCATGKGGVLGSGGECGKMGRTWLISCRLSSFKKVGVVADFSDFVGKPETQIFHEEFLCF